jgi:hypothetical protein
VKLKLYWRAWWEVDSNIESLEKELNKLRKITRRRGAN